MRALALAVLLLLPAGLVAQRAPTVTKVAEGVYLFRTPPYSDVGLDGNSVAIIGSDGVLVFDTNGTPAAAALVLAEIRKLTTVPVKYIVNSHWHWDHWYGTQSYLAAFPNAALITQENTRILMAGPALEFNRPGLESQLPGHIADVEHRRAAATTASDSVRLAEHLRQDRDFLEQKRTARHPSPTLTFRDSLTIWLGEREVRVLHYDRGVTPGDALLYLPREKLVISGDLLINPITYALGSYPEGWIRSLEQIASLDAVTYLPGHGEPVQDRGLLETTLALLKELKRLGLAARARGLDVEAVRKEAGPAVAALRDRLTKGDAGLNQSFDVYMVDWFLHRVYDEAAGPLDNSIAPIPRHP